MGRYRKRSGNGSEISESGGGFCESGYGFRTVAVISLALILLTVAVYLQVGNHDFLNYDDNVYVTGNPQLANGITGSDIVWAFTSFHASNWHPVTWLSHLADVALYDMDPRGHHLTSVAIHALSTLLLFLLLLRLTGALWKSSCVAALFAVHPTHVESVAWVAERKDVLSAFFWFLTLFSYAAYANARKRRYYLLTLVFFVLGLMAKPMLVTLPLVMLLLDYWPLDRRRNDGWVEGLCRQLGRGSPTMELVKEKIPFFACALASSVVTFLAQHAGGAVKSLEALSFPFRIENALVAYVTYIGNLLWPDDLAILYPIPPSYPVWQAGGSLLILMLVSTTVYRVRHRSPYLVVGWTWFIVTLIPVIGIVQVGVQSMADRYTYIPSIGLFIMAVWGIADLMGGLKHRKVILALLAGAVITAMTAVTWQQLHYWRDDIPLYLQTLEVTDDNYVIHNNLGNEYANKWDMDAAIREFREALRINPNYSDAHYNLGMACAMTGDLDTAIRELREALRINPDHAKARRNLSMALAQKEMAR